MCDFICERIPDTAKLLEVGIGTGYPFAVFFQRLNYEVHGIGISPALVAKFKSLNSAIICKVGDAEENRQAGLAYVPQTHTYLAVR